MARIVTIKPKPKHGKPYEVHWSWYDTSTTPATRRFGKERFSNETAAKARKREVERAVADGNILDYMAGKAPLSEWAERWFLADGMSWKPSTKRGYRSILDNSVLPTFGSKRIRSISTGDVEDFIARLHGRGLTPPTIRHHYVVLRSVLGYAARMRAISHNPARDARLPTDKSTERLKPEANHLTEQQVANLAMALSHTDPYPLMVRFMAYTGLRAGEVAGLNVGDLDLRGGRVKVKRTRRKVRASEESPDGWEVHTPKSGKSRVVPIMSPKLRADLREFITRHPNSAHDAAPLWPGRVNGGQERFKGGTGTITYDQPWERDAFYKRQFKPALKAAELPEAVRLHDLRHTFASICASKGIRAAQVAEWMGHANEVITKMIYTHLFEEDSAQYADAFTEPEASTHPSVVTRLDRRRTS